MLHLSCISGDAADIFDIRVSYALQRTDRLSASGPAVTIGEHGGILMVDQAGHLVKGLQRHVFAAGDMALPVFLRRADIQQDRAGRGLIIFYTLTDVGSFQEIEESQT